MNDMDVLERARAGDDAAFADLTAPHLPELRVHCYRMLGSLVDAEDALQETLLAAWRGLGDYAERASVRTWLYRIATNRCLNVLRTRRRRPPAPISPFTVPEPTRRSETTWLQPLPEAWLVDLPDASPGPTARYEQRESVALAFVAALQHLPPPQLAAVLLCDVLGYPLAEAADLLDTTAVVVKGALQRGRAALPLADATAAAPTDVAERFAAAFTAHDVDGLLSLLRDDATLAMPPAPHEYVGVPAIAAFLRASFAWHGDRPTVLLPVSVNRGLGFGWYVGEPDAGNVYGTGIISLELAGETIASITRFHDAALLERFGLPSYVAR